MTPRLRRSGPPTHPARRRRSTTPSAGSRATRSWLQKITFSRPTRSGEAPLPSAQAPPAASRSLAGGGPAVEPEKPVERERARPERHDRERHRGPGQMEVGIDELDDGGHAEKPERG